ncbi:MAG TPA: DUF1707 domain-containing protein [Solirubrobacteraceae bacterium]|nr:DUF1707 domain-containing protein [Solirubrobacteraceae bacterium]
MRTSPLTTRTEPIRASDADRAKALELLREHWLAGRLDAEEYEQRCGEAAAGRFLDDLRRALRELPYPPPERAPAPRAQPQPAAQGGAVLSVVLGALSLLGVVFSFGLLFMLTLPASASAWLLGRGIRRSRGDATRGDVHVVAAVGEALGIVGTLLGCLALAACATLVGVV